MKFWFDLVIAIDHPHTHNGTCGQYVEVCGPQGPIFKNEEPAFFLANKAATWPGSGLIW